jgi:DNA-binding IclR family transcriptional regulator
MQTITKAGQVLGLFSVERPEWGVGDAAQALKYPKSSTSASKRVRALLAQGALRKAPGLSGRNV